MLASITPLGERSRRSHWAVTVAAFAIAATAAGAAIGALAGLLGAVLEPAGFAPRARLAALAAAVLLAIVLDALPRAVPGPRRQVNERWLDQYRGWVYGLGYGAQLGLGVTTVVSSAATYVALVAGLLTADWTSGALIVGCFGAVRGLSPLAAGGVRSPAELLSMHRALARWRAPASAGALAVLAATSSAALAGALA